MHHSTARHADPAAQSSTVRRWGEQTWALLADYCADVHERDPRDCPFDEHVVVLAGWEILDADADDPCWSKLDVEPLLECITGDLEEAAALRHSAVITLMTFYCFLVKHGHLSREQAAGVVDQLAPLWHEACGWVMVQLTQSAPAYPRRTAAARPN